ncbi:MAG: NADH-quinone oxidoreductase subunit J [Ardenticatenaceae bacterium]|nr:NADH-quinone oxidoreductase subunit J [Anaerolineales bacterium]MCB8941312.1 NADH-quinone oxidoreductase subunit J [Ardenticatenaceae bacterium]MCB8972667.1 NADH-quinone oxidoreductase subunit J [Ardenticatenaceae bacterium]
MGSGSVFIVFILMAIVSIAAATMMLRSKNAVHSALWLVLNFTAIAVLYVLLNAPFIAMVQITVYAGAIMVLFLFVIMLLGAEQLQGITGGHGTERYHQAVAIGLVVLLVVGFGIVLTQGGTGGGETAVIDASPVALGLRLFEGYVLPFEVTGILLLAAIIGVAVFTRRKKKEA